VGERGVFDAAANGMLASIDTYHTASETKPLISSASPSCDGIDGQYCHALCCNLRRRLEMIRGPNSKCHDWRVRHAAGVRHELRAVTYPRLSPAAPMMAETQRRRARTNCEPAKNRQCPCQRRDSPVIQVRLLAALPCKPVGGIIQAEKRCHSLIVHVGQYIPTLCDAAHRSLYSGSVMDLCGVIVPTSAIERAPPSSVALRRRRSEVREITEAPTDAEQK